MTAGEAVEAEAAEAETMDRSYHVEGNCAGLEKTLGKWTGVRGPCPSPLTQEMHPVRTLGVSCCCGARAAMGTRQMDAVPKLVSPFWMASSEHRFSYPGLRHLLISAGSTARVLITIVFVCNVASRISAQRRSVLSVDRCVVVSGERFQVRGCRCCRRWFRWSNTGVQVELEGKRDWIGM